MLHKERIQSVLDRLAAGNVEQMLVTDAMSIAWMCDQMIHTGERFLGLFLKKGEKPVLFVNDLFPVEKEEGITLVRFNDADDVLSTVCTYVDPDRVLAVDGLMSAACLLRLQEERCASSFVNGSFAVNKSRAVKDEEELRIMREASRINDEAMRKLRACLCDGITEKEVADRLMPIYVSMGAEDFSFPPIVSFGANAADPHHMPDETVLKEGDCVLFDIGCVYHEYCSDMTRTYYWRKEPDARIRQIYELVRSANEEAEKMLKADVILSDVDGRARSIIAEGGYGPNFTHRLGHFIGRTDHEAGDVSGVNMDHTEIGNVFSIEPGIYLEGDTGVRIEDLVVITEKGYEVLNHVGKELKVLPE